MKYIIFRNGPVYHPVVFADHTTHSEVILKDHTPVSAGFVQWGACGVVKVYGKSDSLNLKNNGEFDKCILNAFMYNSGISEFIDYSKI